MPNTNIKEAVEKLWKGYASAILFSENDLDTDSPLDESYDINDFDKKTISESKKLLKKFYTENKEAIIESGLDLDTVGNDVWFTRAGHGAGFFDHSLDDDIERQLIVGAEKLGQFPSVETHNGKISVSSGRVFADGGENDINNLDYWESYNDDKSTINTKKSYSVKSKNFIETFDEAVENWNEEADEESKLSNISFRIIRKKARDFFDYKGWISVNVIQAMISQLAYAQGGETDKEIIELTPIYTKRDSKGFRFYSADNGNKLYAEKKGDIYEVDEDTLKPTYAIPLRLTRFKFVGLINDEDSSNLDPLHYEREAIARVRKSFGMAEGGKLKVGDTIYRAWFTDDDGDKHSAIIVATSEKDAEKIAMSIDADSFSYVSNPIKIQNEEVLFEESREKEPIYKMAEGGETDSNTYEKVKVIIRDVDMGGDVVYKGEHWFRKDQLANKTNEQIGKHILNKYFLDYGNTYKFSIVKTGITKTKMEDGGETDNDDLLEFTIPNWALPFLINGDEEGLSEEEYDKLYNFVDEVRAKYGTAWFMLPDEDKMDLGFKHSNDIDNLGSDCSLLYLRPEKEFEYAKGGQVLNLTKTEKDKLRLIFRNLEKLERASYLLDENDEEQKDIDEDIDYYYDKYYKLKSDLISKYGKSKSLENAINKVAFDYGMTYAEGGETEEPMWVFEDEEYTDKELIELADEMAEYDRQDTGEYISITDIDTAIDYLGDVRMIGSRESDRFERDGDESAYADGGEVEFNWIIEFREIYTERRKTIRVIAKTKSEAIDKAYMELSNRGEDSDNYSVSFAYPYGSTNRKRKLRYDNGGDIPNNYEGLSEEDVWEEWDIWQRTHFLNDHHDKFKKVKWEMEDSFDRPITYRDVAKYYSFNELPYQVKQALREHIEEGQYAKGGNVPSIEKRVAEVNKLIEYAHDKKLEVVDESTTWQAPLKFMPLKYSNGVLYVSFMKLDLYKYNKGMGTEWKKESYKIGKNELGSSIRGNAQKEALTDIARMHRKAINHFEKYGYADGGETKREYAIISYATEEDMKDFEADNIQYRNSIEEAIELAKKNFQNGNHNSISVVDVDTQEQVYSLPKNKYAEGGETNDEPSKKEMLDYLNMYFDYYSELRTIAVEEDNILTKKMLPTLDDEQIEMAYEDARYEVRSDLEGYGYAKGGKVKGDVGKSGTQYGYTLKEWEAMAKKNGLLVSPSQWWKNQKGKKYKDSFGRTKTIGQHSFDEKQEMDSYGYRIAIGLDLGSKIIPASAKKYVEENNYSKYAEGGIFEHGLEIGDKIISHKLKDDSIIVENNFRHEKARVYLDKGKRNLIERNNNKYDKGGPTFDDKVDAISKALLERKKVSPSVQKDYGKTYNKKEAIESAKRIAGAMRKKEKMAKGGSVNLKSDYLSSSDYQKAKKLKTFNAEDWKWDSSKDLYAKVKKKN